MYFKNKIEARIYAKKIWKKCLINKEFCVNIKNNLKIELEKNINANSRILIFIPLNSELKYLDVLKNFNNEIFAPFTLNKSEMEFRKVKYNYLKILQKTILKNKKLSNNIENENLKLENKNLFDKIKIENKETFKVNDFFEIDFSGLFAPKNFETKLNFPLNKNDLVLVPSLGLNKEKIRLGRGGGYYDRMKENFGNSRLITFVPELLTNLNFISESHDLKINNIITENKIYF